MKIVNDKIEIINSACRLQPGFRGGIICPILRPPPLESHAEIEPFLEYDEDAARGAVLLFDVLDSPRFSFFKAATGGSFPVNIPDGIEEHVRFLRTIVSNRAERISLRAIQNGLVEALNERNRQDEDMWAICRGSDSLILKYDELSDRVAFKIGLYRALPVPGRQVPFEDVAAFRERRRPELSAFRHHLEGLEQEVNKNGFSSLAQSTAFERLQGSIDDYHKAIGEKNFRKSLMSLDISFQWDKLISDPRIVAAAAATAESVYVGKPFLHSALHAVIAAGAIVTLKSVRPLLGQKGGKGPFDYLFKAEFEM